MKRLAFVSLILIFSTCKKDDPKQSQPDIYVGGMEGDGLYSIAKYWKNGIETLVRDGGINNTYASGMAVSGTDVYLAGFEINGTKAIATYWKNGEPKALTDGTYLASANSVALVGSDVYVAGEESNEVASVAKYWKNGVAVSLTDGTRDAHTNGIVVNGNDVYVVGDESGVAKYWKNGNPTVLGAYPSETSSIAVSGSDVYVLGYQTTPDGIDAVVWKNGVSTFIADGVTTAVHQIVINVNDVYVCGTSNARKAFYWKNGSVVALTDSTTFADATAMALYNKDLYVVGYEVTKGKYNSEARIAKYWKNGLATSFTTNDEDNTPWAIVVK